MGTLAFVEQITGHSAGTALTALDRAVAKLPAERLIGETLEPLQRISRVAEHVLAKLAASDPYLVPISALNNIEQAAINSYNEINAYASNANIGHVSNAMSHVDAILLNATQLPTAGDPDVEGMNEALKSFRRSAGQLLGSLERQAQELEASTASIRDALANAGVEISAQKARLDSAISEYQAQFSQAESSRRDEFSRAMQDAATRLNDSVDKQRDRVDEALKAAQARLTDAQADLTVKLNEIKHAGLEDSKAVIADLEQMRKQAQELMHVIGNIGMTGDYRAAATSARNRAWLWQGVTVAAIAGLIGFAIAAFYTTTTSDFKWAEVGTRTFVAVAFGVLAAFASRQADRSYLAEMQNRRYQLSLSSIDPYLITLPEEMRHEVKIKLAERLFGAPPADLADSPRDQKFTGTGIDVIKTALDTIHELVKKR